MPPFLESSVMVSAVPLKQSEGIAIPAQPSSWRVPRRVEWETGEEHQEVEDALSANSSGSSPRRLGRIIGNPSVGSLPKRARLGCAGKLVISNQALVNFAKSAPAPAISVAASVQFSSSPFARLTLQPGSFSNGVNPSRTPSPPAAPSVDRTVVSGDANELLNREPGYSSKSSEDGFNGARFELDPDMESDAESIFWPVEGANVAGGMRSQERASQSDVSVDERRDVIGRLSEAASEAPFDPSILYFAVLAMDLCLATMWRPVSHKSAGRTRGLGFTCLYLAANQLGAATPLEKFVRMAAVQESWVGPAVVEQQQQEVLSLLDVEGGAGGLDREQLWERLAKATGKTSEAVYMAEFVSLLTGSDYSVDHFSLEMISASSNILEAPEDPFALAGQARVLAAALHAACLPKEPKDSLRGGFVFGAATPSQKSASKPHCRAQAGPVSAFKGGSSHRLVKWK